MEETEPVKEWFVTHDGKQFGPVSKDDLKFEAERGELNPRLDMVWKNGMEDWIPAGEVEGLFKRNEEAKAAEEAKETAFTEFKPDISEEEKKIIKGEWTGAGRGTYLFVCYVLPFLWMAGVGYGMGFLEGKVEAGILAIGGLALCLVPLILVIAATLQRFQNLGMSRVWFLGLFVPLLNLWVWYRLFACPPGYAYHKKLDPLGWVLAVLYWLTNIAFVAAVAGAIYLAAGNPEAFRKLAEESEGKPLGELVEEIRGIAAERDKPVEPQQKPAE
jgi:hypothetical protein